MTLKLKFESLAISRNRLDRSKSKQYKDISEGLLPPPISIGARRMTSLAHENDAMIAAFAAGKNNEEIKGLVKSLVQKRQELLGEISCL